MHKRYLEVGKTVTTFGILGEIKVEVWGDSPDFITGLDTLYLDEGRRSVHVEHARVHKNAAVLKLEGVETVEQATKLRGCTLYVDREDISLPEGRYFIQDLIGLRAVDADTGREYGIVSDVSETGANDVYHIKSGGKEYLIPAVIEMVPGIDIQNGVMLLRPVKGIFDDDD